jgi:hypothetical protein
MLRAGNVQPDEIAPVIGDAHLVGLGVVDPDEGLGDARDRHDGLSGLVTFGKATE